MSETSTAEELRIDNDALRECILRARNRLAVLLVLGHPQLLKAGIREAIAILDSQGAAGISA